MTKKVDLNKKGKPLDPSIREQNSSPVCYLESEDIQENYRIIKSENPLSEARKDHKDSLKKKK